MTIANALGLVLGGLILLAGGGEALVRGATAIARRAGVTPAVIGLTIVAAGTSLPELVVSVLAALGGKPEIAVGTVVGSNIFNILGVLGLTAIVTAVKVHGSSVKYEWPFMFLVSCLVVVVAHDGEISRFEGALMLAGFTLFTGFMLQVARREIAADEAEALAREVHRRTIRAADATFALSAVAVVVGILLLVLGGSSLVSGAVELARIAGISERVIGLTVVAIGTSMPELAASVVAARHGHTDVAIANLIGSNVFNILGILGATALIRPTPVGTAMLNSDMAWMMCSAFALLPIMRTGMRVSRWEGVLLLALYVAYLVTLLR